MIQSGFLAVVVGPWGLISGVALYSMSGRFALAISECQVALCCCLPPSYRGGD